MPRKPPAIEQREPLPPRTDPAFTEGQEAALRQIKDDDRFIADAWRVRWSYEAIRDVESRRVPQGAIRDTLAQHAEKLQAAAELVLDVLDHAAGHPLTVHLEGRLDRHAGADAHCWLLSTAMLYRHAAERVVMVGNRMQSEATAFLFNEVPELLTRHGIDPDPEGEPACTVRKIIAEDLAFSTVEFPLGVRRRTPKK